ncbi:hypothetical protein DER45DRAFT_52037 [Fusarium avenaceum]|nr:hypothetical protein DER45DRAFT_52037 [Fusarium avenaceum]
METCIVALCCSICLFCVSMTSLRLDRDIYSWPSSFPQVAQFGPCFGGSCPSALRFKLNSSGSRLARDPLSKGRLKQPQPSNSEPLALLEILRMLPSFLLS